MKACGEWFDVVKVDDKTEDYRLTGARDRKHFQAVNIRWTPKKLGYIAELLLLDPFVLHRLLYYTQDSWMHYYGENPYSDQYDAEFRRRVSFVVLFWITLVARRQVKNPQRGCVLPATKTVSSRLESSAARPF